MPKKSKKKEPRKETKKEPTMSEETTKKINLKTETVHWVVSIFFFVVSVFFVLASFHKGGMVGDKLFDWMTYLLGVGYFLLPALFFILGASYAREVKTDFATVRILGSIIFILSGLGIIDVVEQGEGGLLGNLISMPMIKLFDVTAGLLILSALLIVSIVIIFDTTPDFKSLMFWRKNKNPNSDFDDDDFDEEIIDEKIAGDENEKDTNDSESKLKGILNFSKKEKSEEENFDEKIETTTKKKFFGNKKITLPINLLSKDKGKPGVGDIKANSNIIKRCLYNFGISVEMDEISIGPSVTRYALNPAEGVKLSRIVALQNDLSLALAAHPLRIEAPIPGKALVGIEIPNSTKTTVGLASAFELKNFQESENPLTIALGKDISGNFHFSNLAKAPHMLIAGSTGSGKSVTIHTLIISLLYRNNPEEMRFIMIDPKRVELTLYKNIPHLLTPVITDAKKAILALKWAIKEMDRRYEILEAESVRDIQSYHKNILEPARKKLEGKKDVDEKEIPEAMPFIVVIIDELADIMQTYPRELESAIVRLAQMSRAVGIHLI